MKQPGNALQLTSFTEFFLKDGLGRHRLIHVIPTTISAFKARQPTCRRVNVIGRVQRVQLHRRNRRTTPDLRKDGPRLGPVQLRLCFIHTYPARRLRILSRVRARLRPTLAST